MPQGRRKVPFSAKQKKLQLQAKRQKKQGILGKFIQKCINFKICIMPGCIVYVPFAEHSDDSERSKEQPRVQKINQQPSTAAGKSNR